LDYAGLHQVWVLDRASGREVDASTITLLRSKATMPGTLERGPSSVAAGGLQIRIDEVAGGTRLRATTGRVSLDVVAQLPHGHERMGVVVPWSERLFQYTVKDVARPASGTLTVDGVPFEVPAGESWAVLDHGR